MLPTACPSIPASCEPKRILKHPYSPQYSLRTVGETKARVTFNTKTRVTFDTKARVKFNAKTRVKFNTKTRVKFNTKARVKFNAKARQGMSSPWLLYHNDIVLRHDGVVSLQC